MTMTTHTAVSTWMEEGWTEAEAREWLAAGFQAGSPDDPDDQGCPEDRDTIRAHARLARTWHNAGIPPTIATPWAHIIDDPEEASLWALAGYTPPDVAMLYAAVTRETKYRDRTGEPPIPYAPLDWITIGEPVLVIRIAVLAGYTPTTLARLRAETGGMDREGLLALARYRHTG